MNAQPPLPEPRGPLSEALERVLRGGGSGWFAGGSVSVDEPLADDDLHLSLYLCYELHYRGLDGVDPGLEWDPAVLTFRAALERPFERALRDAVRVDPPEPAHLPGLLRSLARGDTGRLSRFLERHATLEQFREFLIHRSAYHLKEADPHSFAIPRLAGAAKTAIAEIQADEYGGGRPEWMHATLFAGTMRALGLDDAEGALLDRIPGWTLATVNAMSLFGLHRRLRGAAVGHLAMFELTSTTPNRRYGNGLRRLGFDDQATRFFDEHVEADAVHEAIAADDLVGSLVEAEPELAPDVLFGARALLALEGRFGERLLSAWRCDRSSLRPTDRPHVLTRSQPPVADVA